MHRVPMGRRFGGPEIALIAFALAFAAAMTAWWHGLYEQPKPVRQQARLAAPALPAITVSDGANVRSFTAVGYLIDADSSNGLVTPPSFDLASSPAYIVPSTPTDPNQTLLLALTLVGAVAVGFYSMSVYPALRR